MSQIQQSAQLDQELGHKAADLADRSKEAGAEAVADAARTAEALAASLDSESPAIAEYVRGAGQKIDRLANDLRDKKLGELLQSVAEFGRSQPVLLMASTALVGFALARVIKSGASDPRVSGDGGASGDGRVS